MTNEQRYKTPEERAEAFSMFCISRKCDDCACAKQGKKGISLCEFRWLALEAEEEKPLACPFCGCDSIDIFETDFGRSEEPYQFVVKCLSCGALVSAEDKAEAIAAWNRRVK